MTGIAVAKVLKKRLGTCCNGETEEHIFPLQQRQFHDSEFTGKENARWSPVSRGREVMMPEAKSLLANKELGHARTLCKGVFRTILLFLGFCSHVGVVDVSRDLNERGRTQPQILPAQRLSESLSRVSTCLS